MRAAFADTGAFYALVDRRDPAHLAAAEFYRSDPRTLVTTDFVFAGTMSLVTKRLGKGIAVRLGHGLRHSPRLRIEEVAPEVREAAWQLFSTQLDEEWDLIDCLSFATMEAQGLTDAFGFDRHFTQRGFVLLPWRAP